MNKNSAVKPKSPFLVEQDLFSPLLCDQVIDNLADAFIQYETNNEGDPLVTSCNDESSSNLILNTVEHKLIPTIEKHFNVTIDKMSQPQFLWYPENFKDDGVKCDNSDYIERKWVKTRSRDFSVTIFLCEYCDSVPFDNDYEVYGGKIEYPQYNFGFNSERGTAIVHPSDPRFLHHVDQVYTGDLLLARLFLVANESYLYNPNEYPGDYRSWFENLSVRG